MMLNKKEKLFYEATERSELLIQQCKTCDEYSFYPKQYCSNCFGELAFVKATGFGKIITYTIVHYSDDPVLKDELPYVAAIVELEEGPNLFAIIETDDPTKINFGQKVYIDFKDYQDKKVPVFRCV